MATTIHPTAIIEPGAQLGEGVYVGAYAFIGSEVKLGADCRVEHHASITGKTTVGPANHFYSFVSIGEISQDLKYADEPTYLEIGAENTCREYMTINRGTAPGAKTVVGSHNHFLAYTHIAHDCVVGSHNVFSNAATLGGHVLVQDHVTVGGFGAVHQFCRIGDHAMIGGCSKIVQDAPPYFVADGNPAKVRGVNIIGLRRKSFPNSLINELRKAFRLLYDSALNTAQALERIEQELPATPELKCIVQFVRESERGIIR